MLKAMLLIVDDEPQNLHILIEIMKSDYRIKIAKNGLKALAIAEKEAPSVVLLDVNMPEMDGFSVCERLKANPVTQDIPVIFLSSSMSQADREKGMDVGAVDFVTKPVIPDDLKRLIESVL